MTVESDALTLIECVNNVARLQLSDNDDENCKAIAILDEAARELAGARRRLGDLVGNRMKTRRHVVQNIGAFERHARREGSVKCTDEEGLWRLVIDTRIVDEETGEVLPTHEVIRRVYGAESKETGKVRLTGASPSKVEQLGIDPDNFFEKGDIVGWNVRLKS